MKMKTVREIIVELRVELKGTKGQVASVLDRTLHLLEYIANTTEILDDELYWEE